MSCIVVKVSENNVQSHPLRNVKFRKARKGAKGYVLSRVPREYLDFVCARLFQLGAKLQSDVFESKGLYFIHFTISNEYAAKMAAVFPAPSEKANIGLSRDGRKVLKGLSERRTKVRQTKVFNPGLKIA